jgi:hypothetical protein
MKRNFMKGLGVAVALLVAAACADEQLDPLRITEVKKGAVLALRGTQLDNIYFSGLPGYEVFPRALDGSESFDFDAEFLAEDPSTLASFDIFVIRKNAGGGSTRVPIKNVPFSEFKKTDDYRNPWVSVSIPFGTILTALNLSPSAPDFADVILSQYSSGIAIESDLNLVDGSKILAAELVAAGLFQSNQFYPAQKLNIAVTDYCPEDIAATYSFSTTVTAVGAGGVIAGCAGGVTGTGEFKSISRGKYSVSDASFGQYDCAWSDDPATGVTITNTCDLITTGGADQYDLVYTLSNLQVSPDGKTMSFSWENDYGDRGNTILTRTSAGTWPTTLFTED